MPGLDQKGPIGQGPMTGRRMGRCSNYGSASAKETKDENRRENYPGKFQGRGLGFGRPKGRRGVRGFGAGEQNRFRGDF